ncbi:glycoside hydrolase family 5 protein [Flavobacterium agrisoli]|uniref:Glycoside hydrolase family 5 protein n=1 Tax=Flavobacterium agrisoli TaxID=2793066 RepID=A0A934PLP3_9FLAO|nr:glycoside hydrolase family 5 protein [Flavobacterium agrisoli]MBK0369095.1 glycoside hydrolase family 5 protein [Flavobacterium agrisoli]
MKNVTAFLLFFSTIGNAQFVSQHGQLSVSGTQLLDENKQAVVLRGMSFGWHSLWPRFYNEKTVSWLLKDFNCTVVRAAMGIEFGKNSYLDNPKAAQEKIEKVVQGAIQSDIYVIIDWHSHNINLAEAKVFFDGISKKYGKFPNILYEIFNEPDHETWPEVKRYSEEIIKVIRKNDSHNIILVGSPHWDQDIDLVADNPILNQKNIMYTLHFYAATHKKELQDKADYALQKGIPLFVSESAGMEASGDGNLDMESWKSWINWMENRKISWVTWSVSDKDETCSILKKSACSTGNWKDSDLNESGILIRSFLRKYNSMEME